jgi:type VI secretion system protein ImpK
MREDLANLVHPVLAHALAVKERLDRGEAPALDATQAVLKDLLLTDLEAKRWVDYGGETVLPTAVAQPEPRAEPGQEGAARPEPFAGARYALVCWLDELFILYSPWSAQWNERKLEVTLYGSNDRAWKFWQQTHLAEERPTPDALEVFFLCVMLGFRGDRGDEPERLRAWVSTNQARLTRLKDEEWPAPPELDPTTDVPPLRARERFQRVVYFGGVVVLLLIPVLAFLVVNQFGM